MMSNLENPEELIHNSRNNNLPSSLYDVVEEAAPSHQRKTKRTATKRLLENLKSHPSIILTTSCVIAVLVDPLFFYLPIIDEKKKCIGMDTILRNVAIIFRSLTDIGFIVNIIHKIHEAVEKTRADSLQNIKKRTVEKLSRDERNKFAKSLAHNLSWHTILIDFLAVLPIPQVIIVAVRSSRCLDKRKILNFLLLAQYLPRVYRMRHSSKQLRQKTGIWVKGSFYFFLYILASHVLGAFWYYFSIQQETSCWHRACKKHGGGVKCNFYCHENMTSRDLTFINSIDKYCLVDVPANETAPFDFGIFLDSLKNNNTASIKFLKKFLYSFWWGLRNLSNFGTNLQTSTYVWENCFAILISIIGLLLFLYLIGKVQTFISMKTANYEERRKKFKSKDIDIQMWMERNGLIKRDVMKDIRVNTKKKWEEIRDADIENLFSILPVQSRKDLKHSLCMEMLSKVPKLKNLEDEALKSICDCLKPVVYQDNSFVFQEGEPLDRILFIIEGLIWTYQAAGTTDSSSTSQNGKGKTGFSFLEKGGFYGDDQLLSWVIASHNNDLSYSNLPISKVNVKCHTKVEGFVLKAKDLKKVVVSGNNYKVYWGFHEREAGAVRALKKGLARRNKADTKGKSNPLPARPLATIVDADVNSPTTSRKDL